jgi:hypothetical protein
MKTRSYKNRWIEPPGRAEREEYRQLRRELKNSRTLKARRLEIEARLDEIAAAEPESILSELPPPKPTTKDLLALCARVDDAKRKGSLPEKSILPLEGVRVDVDAFVLKMTGHDREGATRRAQNATEAERAGALLTELPEHPLNKLAAELALYIWQEDKSSRKPDAKQIALWTVQGWLEKRLYNRHDIRGSVATVANAVTDVYRLLAERDAEDPIWFVRRAEKLFDDAGLDPAKPPAAVPVPAVDLAALSVPEPVHPARTTDLLAQVDLILQVVDAQWLGRLVQQSPALDSQIRGAITLQLQEHGHCDGMWLANLYNTLRPKALSAFPPRTF